MRSNKDRRGFTEVPRIQELLTPYEIVLPGQQPFYVLDLVEFDHVPTVVMAEIGTLMPEDVLQSGQNEAPSMAELLTIGTKLGCLFGGYRITSQRLDERITIDTIYIPLRRVDDAKILINVDSVSEWDQYTINGVEYMRAWWD